MFYTKKKEFDITAYPLFPDNPDLAGFLQEGSLRYHEENHTWEIFSQESVNGGGEIAQDGDYMKIDAKGYPYPNAKEKFEANHIQVGPNTYRQKNKPLQAWDVDEPWCDEMQYLVDHKELVIDSSQGDKYFTAPLWGQLLSAAKNAVIVFYSVERDEDGKIRDVDFNFVERKVYEETYERVK